MVIPLDLIYLGQTASCPIKPSALTQLTQQKEKSFFIFILRVAVQDTCRYDSDTRFFISN